MGLNDDPQVSVDSENDCTAMVVRNSGPIRRQDVSPSLPSPTSLLASRALSYNLLPQLLLVHPTKTTRQWEPPTKTAAAAAAHDCFYSSTATAAVFSQTTTTTTTTTTTIQTTIGRERNISTTTTTETIATRLWAMKTGENEFVGQDDSFAQASHHTKAPSSRCTSSGSTSPIALLEGVVDTVESSGEQNSTASETHSVTRNWANKYDFDDAEVDNNNNNNSHHEQLVDTRDPQSDREENCFSEQREPVLPLDDNNNTDPERKEPEANSSSWYCSIPNFLGRNSNNNYNSTDIDRENDALRPAKDDVACNPRDDDESTMLFNPFHKSNDDIICSPSTSTLSVQGYALPSSQKVTSKPTADLTALAYELDRLSLNEKEEEEVVFDKGGGDGGLFSRASNAVHSFPQLLCPTIPRVHHCLHLQEESEYNCGRFKTDSKRTKRRTKRTTKPKKSGDIVASSKSSSSEEPNIELELQANKNSKDTDTIVIVDAVVRALRRQKKKSKSKTVAAASADAMDVLLSLNRMERFVKPPAEINDPEKEESSSSAGGLTRVPYDGTLKGTNDGDTDCVNAAAVGRSGEEETNNGEFNEDPLSGYQHQLIEAPLDLDIGSDSFSIDGFPDIAFPDEGDIDMRPSGEKEHVGVMIPLRNEGKSRTFHRLSSTESSSFDFVESLSLSEDRIPSPPHQHKDIARPNVAEELRAFHSVVSSQNFALVPPLAEDSPADTVNTSHTPSPKNLPPARPTKESTQVLLDLIQPLPKHPSQENGSNDHDSARETNTEVEEIQTDLSLSLSEECPIPPSPKNGSKACSSYDTTAFTAPEKKQILPHLTIHRMLRNANMMKNNAQPPRTQSVSQQKPMTKTKASQQTQIAGNIHATEDSIRVQRKSFGIGKPVSRAMDEENGMDLSCRHEPNHQKRSGCLPKGILRSECPPSDRLQHVRCVHWDEAQLANKIEKGVMFPSNGKWRKPAFALARLMTEITAVQDGYGDNGLEKNSWYQHRPQGYIC